MPKNKITLQFDGFQNMARKLDELGGDINKAVEEALIQSQEYVTDAIRPLAKDNKYPHEGKYANGDTEESVIDDKKVTWEGTTASINVGFDFNISGLNSIWLMYGTPKQDPVAGLYEAVYGNETKKAISKIQRQIFNKAIKDKLEG